jgi:DNA-binding GntR family transcriptional regulator
MRDDNTQPGAPSALTITPEQLKELRSLLERMEKAAARGDLDAYHPLNLQFHDTLVGFAGNQKLLHTYRQLVNELNLFRRHMLAQRDRLPGSTREHQKIVDAIAAGDPDTAGRLLHAHAMASRERMHKAHAPAAAVVPLGSRKATHRKSK